MGPAVEIQEPVPIHIVMKHLMDKRVLQPLVSPHEALGVTYGYYGISVFVMAVRTFD